MFRIAYSPVALLPLLIGAHSVFADAEWDELSSAYEQARTEFMKKMDQGDGMVHFDPSTHMPEDAFRQKFRAYAEKHAGQPAAVPALGWLVTHEMGFPGMPKTDSAAAWALEGLEKSHAADPAIKDHLGGLQFAVMSVGEDALVGFLETVAAKNPDGEAKSRARLAMATMLFEGSPFTKMMGGGADRAAKRKRAADIFRALAEEFAEDDVGKEAADYLFVIEHLQIGMNAPDMVGEDVKGNEIKLSQFKGKVVLLVFWGTWCVPCMQMLPHEKEIYEKLKDHPFTILGINSGDDKRTLKRAIKKHDISWPTIMDGPPKPGSICATWAVSSFPTMYLVDHKGVIRHKNLMPFQIDGAIDALMAETDPKD